jgi:hypothetical protein
MTLEEAVDEVLTVLTGQALHYDSQFDRFRVVTQSLNKALRGNALENEWNYYTEQLIVGDVREGAQAYEISADYRFRVINDDAVRLTVDGVPVAWAYFLPRDALHKYRNRKGLWCSYTRKQLWFSRPFYGGEVGQQIELPVMREPRMFRLPSAPFDTIEVVNPDDPEDVVEEVVYPDVLRETVDFEYPDLIIARACWLYAQTDPVMQPRVQTLEEQYKDQMYQLIERDIAFTDSPYQNEILVPVQGDIYGESTHRPWPVANRW